jgi:hypothetical protein
MNDVFTSALAFPTNILDQRTSDSLVLPPLSGTTTKSQNFVFYKQVLGIPTGKRIQKDCMKGITVIQEQSIVKNLAHCTGHFPKHHTHTHTHTHTQIHTHA